MPVLTPEERLGTLFAGRYKLESILGTGGTGVVFEASHFWTSRAVAVKLLKPHLAEDVSLVRRFLQEARSASEVLHANVVQIFDMGSEEDGTVFLAMERFEGESLGERLERLGRLELGECVELLVPIMDALALAHERGVVHRDLKPENVFLHRDLRGRVTPKLLDFGMSKILDPSRGSATQTGTVVGTPYYMAPEQAEGAKDQGPACDVWSMGVVLFRCLSGKLPFSASSPAALLLATVRDRPPPLAEAAPDVPSPIGRVIDRALIADREERWPDMETFLAALREACAETGVPLPSLPSEGPEPERDAFDPGPRHEPSVASGRARRLAVAAGALLAALGGLAWWSWTPDQAAEPPGVARADSTPTGAAVGPDEERAPTVVTASEAGGPGFLSDGSASEAAAPSDGADSEPGGPASRPGGVDSEPGTRSDGSASEGAGPGSRSGGSGPGRARSASPSGGRSGGAEASGGRGSAGDARDGEPARDTPGLRRGTPGRRPSSGAPGRSGGIPDVTREW